MINVEEMRRNIRDEVVSANREERELMCRRHENELEDLKSDHAREIKDLKFKMERATETETAELKKQVTQLEQKLAVTENTIEMMDELTDLQTGMIDVKEVVNQLIKKLPSVDIKSITAGASSS